jgi:hypothetical protein
MKRTGVFVLIGLSITVSLALIGCEGDKKIQPPAPISEAPKTPPAQPGQPAQPAQPVPPPVAIKPATPTTPTVSAKPATPTTPATPAKPVDTGGRIKVENPVVDLGKLGPNKSATAQFKFTNTGSGKLIISQVQSTCSCSVPDLTKLEYEAGESGVVTVTYRSSAYGGPVEKHLYILSNDSTNPRAEISLKGSVELAVVAEPVKLQLALNKDNGGAVPIILKSKDGKPFKVQAINCSRNVITAEFDANAETSEHTLQPKVDMKALKENATGTIEIRLTHPDCDSIAVSYDTLAVYDISRPRIILQNVEPGQTITRDVFIKNNYGQEFSIASVVCQNNTMKIASQEKDGASIKLIVEIAIPPQTNKVRRYITDKLDLTMSDGEVLSINCSGWYKI